MTRRKRPNPPQRLRMKREARLQSARRRLSFFSGRLGIRRYRRHYGVSEVCAVLELRMLGVEVPDARLEQAKGNERARAAHRARRKQRSTAVEGFPESDATFAFIAGYTDGGAPFGVTWEEMVPAEDDADARRRPAARRVPPQPLWEDDDDLPF